MRVVLAATAAELRAAGTATPAAATARVAITIGVPRRSRDRGGRRTGHSACSANVKRRGNMHITHGNTQYACPPRTAVQCVARN